MKDYCENDPEASKGPVFTFNEDCKSSDKVKKDKKKKQHKKKWDSINLATGVNTAEVNDKKRKKKDISEIIYYNYNKKRHYATKCLWPQK